MISENRFYNTTLSDLVRKYEVIKFGHHLAGIDIIVNAAVLPPCIVIIFPTKSIKLRHALYGEGNTVCKLFCSRILTNLYHLSLLLLLRSNQNMADVYGVGQLFNIHDLGQYIIILVNVRSRNCTYWCFEY